jgi:hypothetical protein
VVVAAVVPTVDVFDVVIFVKLFSGAAVVVAMAVYLLWLLLFHFM